MAARSGYRLPTGGRIDRSRTLDFTFNGRALRGHPGDTLASALLASNVSLINRSFKYHRPRGFFGTGFEDPSAMLAVRDAYGYDPAVRAGQISLTQAMEASSVTGWPSVSCDVGALAQLVPNVLAAGFYYKTFKWPNWRWFEPLVRRATGFGRPGQDPARRLVEHRHATCDVLVIGSGPAGLTAAHALRNTGLKVIVAECHHAPGGSLLWEESNVEGESAATYCAKLLRELAAADVSLLTSTMVAGAYDNNVFTLVQSLTEPDGIRGERLWKLKAEHVVLAAGMIDRPLLFEGNDRPGIMLSSAVRRLIGEFAVAPAAGLAVYTNNDSGYLTAIDAKLAGVDVVALVDTRAESTAQHAARAQALGIECCFDSHIQQTWGYRRLQGIRVKSTGDASRAIACDGLAVAGGWTPLIHLAAHRGIKPVFDEHRSLHVCRDLPANWFTAGGANGALDLRCALDEAISAATAIAAARGVGAGAGPGDVTALSFGAVSTQWLPPHGSTRGMWVDLQNDVKVSDIELAASENYVSVEHLKRYTTLGMGTDQGRTSNVNGLAVMGVLTGRPPSGIGTTTFRPPFSGVRFATIAAARRADLYRPRRLLPADTVHREMGAVMDDFGWERPDWYRSNGDDREAAVATEMRAVRTGVGVFDSSSLGKIEVTGADAAAFLARFYVSNMATLKPGKIRYSVMLREDGTVLDDGVVTCIANGHFLASPTSGNAESVAEWFERWRQTEWPAMSVALTTVSSNWAAIAIAGPKARELLHSLRPDFDVSAAAFPHMEFREGTLAGIPARVARVSFTGELQYEISVPARYGHPLVQALLSRSETLAPKPVGLEAWLRLRLEKGYLHVGSDTNGRTTPLDIGMAGIVAKRQDDFLGKRSLSLPFATSSEREQLVGVIAVDGMLKPGGRVMAEGHLHPPCPTRGYVTSACFSPSLGQSIGLALLERGRELDGSMLRIYSSGQIVRARVCNPTFYDPCNARLQA